MVDGQSSIGKRETAKVKGRPPESLQPSTFISTLMVIGQSSMAIGGGTGGKLQIEKCELQIARWEGRGCWHRICGVVSCGIVGGPLPSFRGGACESCARSCIRCSGCHDSVGGLDSSDDQRSNEKRRGSTPPLVVRCLRLRFKGRLRSTGRRLREPGRRRRRPGR